MKQTETVKLTITMLITHLHSGLTWLKKDDIGYGSTQETYDATEMQILTMMKHPKLIDIEPVRVFFDLIDDTETKVEEVIQAAPIIQEEDQVGGVYEEASAQPEFHLHNL